MLSAAWLRQAPAAAGKEDRPARQAPPWRLTAALASALLAALLGGGGAPEPAGPAAGGPRGDAPDAGALSDHAFLRERVMEEHGWPGPRADGAIAEYLRFLQLLASAPRMELVASDDVDLVWHEHLLDTQNYAADTQRLFGRFLHHRRARSAQEVSDIPAGYARTKEAYRARFGREPPALHWGATTAAASMCGGGGGRAGPLGDGARGGAGRLRRRRRLLERHRTGDGGRQRRPRARGARQPNGAARCSGDGRLAVVGVASPASALALHAKGFLASGCV
ncbi:unnamed protein product [Prorocentrum cordatum]|uniref:Glycine-rich domain-containing protein-like n=1 Tax=Prorocentrum cordatum TaxID=2364126 RepID=A0ABN9VA14_9DINO|nr:unnamed protein product [Polarella glacialis]